MLLAAVAVFWVPAEASCTNYTVKSSPYYSDDRAYTVMRETRQISDVVDCSGARLGSQPQRPPNVTGSSLNCNSTECALSSPSSLCFIAFGSFLNITVLGNITDACNAIMRLVKSHVSYAHDVDFNRTMAYRYQWTAICIRQGTVQYFSLTPYFVCSGDGPADGTAIQAYDIELLDNNNGYNGQIDIVQIAGNALSNPYQSAAAPNASDVPLSSNGAIRVSPTDDFGVDSIIFLSAIVATGFILQ